MQRWTIGLLIVLCVILCCSYGSSTTTTTTSKFAGRRVARWTVSISKGGMSDANLVAAEHACVNLGLVRGFDDVYLFERNLTRELDETRSRSSSSLEEDEPENTVHVITHRTKRQLETHPAVRWADLAMPHERVKRDALSTQQMLAGMRLAKGKLGAHRHGAPGRAPSGTHRGEAVAQAAGVQLTGPAGAFERGEPPLPLPAAASGKFDDELWSHQWYLQDTANIAALRSDVQLNVEEVWRMGYTGKGVVVSILDDGLEWNHTDIKPNYDPRASWDMNNNRSNPFPRYDSIDSNSHGTRCAGEVAMVANNRKCGVGVAPRARIGGIKCLDGEVTDPVEASSLLHNLNYIDIYSGSWGPPDNGEVVNGPGRAAKDALERGIKFGRQGRGALYVWANGNGGGAGDNCNCDGYAISIYTISIGAATQQGQIPWYGERCSSTLAVACSSGAYTERKVVTTDLHNKCTIDYTGTSASAPLAAGVFALALEANRNLTWRDAQHLTAWTSNPIPLRDNPGWKRNAAGLLFNSRFGFGLLNAKAMVDAALKWQTVPRKSVCVVSPSTRLPVYLQSRNMAQAVFVSDGCQREYEKQLAMPQQQQQPYGARHSQPTPVIYLEHVQVEVDIEYTSRGLIDIFLVSPAGTISTLLTRRPMDVSRHGFDKWPLMSVHFWAETSYGKWTLIVRDRDSQNNRGLLRNATLILHGTSVRPAHQAAQRVYEGEAQVAPFIDPVLELDEDDIYDFNTFPNEMSAVRDSNSMPAMVLSTLATELDSLQQRQ